MCVGSDWNSKCSTQTKVCQLDCSLLIDEQVLWLEIAMQNTSWVTEHYALKNLICVTLKKKNHTPWTNYMEVQLQNVIPQRNGKGGCLFSGNHWEITKLPHLIPIEINIEAKQWYKQRTQILCVLYLKGHNIFRQTAFTHIPIRWQNECHMTVVECNFTHTHTHTHIHTHTRGEIVLLFGNMEMFMTTASFP